LDWKVVVVPERSLILGDMGPVCRFQGSNVWSHPMQESLMTAVIALPIAHDRLLLGTKDSAEEFIDTKKLNNATAELCKDFFVAARIEDGDLLALREKIGLRSNYFGELNLEA
jgi:hypothetical protein